MVRLRDSWPFSLSSAPTVGNPCRPLQPESVSGRLWSGQWPGAKSPFCALPVAVDLHNGGVDQGVFQVGLVRDGVEQPLPDIRLHPVAKAGEDAVPVPERGRQIPPRAARADHPQDSLDEQAIVLAAAPRITGLAQTTRLHLRPLGVRQYKAFHPRRKSQPSTDENRESQHALAQFVDQLRIAADIQPPLDLVAHDFGGPFAFAWAVRNPNAVRRMVAINTLFFRDYRWHFWARIWRTPV